MGTSHKLSGILETGSFGRPVKTQVKTPCYYLKSLYPERFEVKSGNTVNVNLAGLSIEQQTKYLHISGRYSEVRSKNFCKLEGGHVSLCL